MREVLGVRRDLPIVIQVVLERALLVADYLVLLLWPTTDVLIGLE